MNFDFDYRPSESNLVHRIWRTQSDREGTFMSQAAPQWEMVVMCLKGETFITLRGPETRASLAYCPPDAEFFGISFNVGTFMPHFPGNHLIDGSVNLPTASRNQFWLGSATWELPTFDNADVFVHRLIREEMLMREPVVEAALQGHIKDLSLRSIQRRFLRTTGLSHNTIYQIERAKRAVSLLEQGVSILDTVELSGYADQPHLTRALKRYMGTTPAQIIQQNRYLIAV